MLQTTYLCLGCIGRFHQLSNFLTQKSTGEKSESDENEITCQFCYSAVKESEIVNASVQEEFHNLVNETKFAEEFKDEENIICCYSCSNFLSMQINYESMLNECLARFFRALSNCKVVINSTNRIKQEVQDDEEQLSVQMITNDIESPMPIISESPTTQTHELNS